jgi:3-hydroxyacyl-[acyl-carrier-protein] dehydratase
MDPREILPHRPPFLFLDEIEVLTPERAQARYRYKPEESFFAGHFPGEPVVPGVIQIETMAQLVVAMGLHAAKTLALPVANIYFSRATECAFHRILLPGDEVAVTAERQWLRMNAIQARAELHEARSGELVAEAVLRGQGKLKNGG